ncbi:MAG: CBS domain-containing protein [Clostridia bacterium]|nr:CBS domain-containing protein [Oscillospiraceae bacterium]MBQ3763260.1 CBS domain-containing protein [Clostridia bacterium]
MKVQEVMSRRIISVSPDENAAVAARLLSHYNIGALPVCTKEGKLRGMVTDRDIVLRCVAAEEDPLTVKVSDIMTRRVFSVGSQQSVDEASALMAREKIRRLPVQDNSRVVGMVSLSDLSKQPESSRQAAQAFNEITSNIRTY